MENEMGRYCVCERVERKKREGGETVGKRESVRGKKKWKERWEDIKWWKEKRESILSRETRIERWEERTPERGREGKKEL